MNLEERLEESKHVPVSGTYGSIIFANQEYKKQIKFGRFRHGLPLVQAVVVGLFAASAVPTITSEPAISPSTPAVLFVVGDVMHKDTPQGAELVGRLLEKSLAETAGYSRAIVVGDLCNDDGAPECYERLERTSWGPLRPLYYSVMGNHDDQPALAIPGSLPYYWNYVLNGGERERGWYAFDWGGWRIINLNSEAMRREHNILSPLGLEQMAWFDRELKQHAKDKCVLTAYHRPMFSSGRFASPKWVGPIFRKSFNYGVDLYVVGHEHFFAHMPPLTPFRGPDNIELVDRSYGIEGLVAGTGGAVLFPHPTVDPNIKRADRGLKWAKDGEEVLANKWGIIQIDLQPDRFQWRFRPVNPEPNHIYPSGSGVCHPNPPRYTEPPLV